MEELMTTGGRKTKEDLERIITVLRQCIARQTQSGQLTSTIGSRLTFPASEYGQSNHSTGRRNQCCRKFETPQSLQIRQLIQVSHHSKASRKMLTLPIRIQFADHHIGRMTDQGTEYTSNVTTRKTDTRLLQSTAPVFFRAQ